MTNHRGDPPPVTGPPRRCDNTSVGVLIADPAGRLLLLRRATPPVGVAPVAGHVDDHGTPADAARQEVAEEVGLTVRRLDLVAEGWRPNACRRPAGPRGTGHHWFLYRAVVAGTVRPDPAAAREVRWHTPDEVQHLVRRTVAYANGHVTAELFADAPGIEPVWVRFLHDLALADAPAGDLAAVDALAGGRGPGPTA
ncbi:NUDIX hydrolase [Micromonospora sp. NPDC051141]|uniref:NUDIX hydrolase n=1 Tax=Micromonospora sp. NPDC051141 TaxID=3364284 RepID=UPI0037AD224D